MWPLVARQVPEGAAGHPEGEEPEWQIDPEDHRPVQVLGEKAAQHWAGNTGGDEHRGDPALVTRPLPGSDHVGDDRLGERDQAATPEALKTAGKDQDEHRGGKRAGNRPDDEDANAKKKDAAPAVDVAELAIERCHRRGAQEVGARYPRQVLEVAELAPDRRHGGGDDRLVESGQEHGEHDPDHDRADGGMVQRGCRGVRVGVHRLFKRAC